MSNLRRAIGASCVVAFVLLHAEVAALAATYDNIHPTANHVGCYEGDVCLQDNANVSVYLDSLGERMRQATYDTLRYSFDTTDLSVSVTTNLVTTGSGETDIVYRYAPLAGNFVGRGYCDDNSPGSDRCDQFYVDYDGQKLCPNGPSSLTDLCLNPNAQRHLACHETGHAVGLLHGEDAAPRQSDDRADLECMRTPIPSSYPYLLGAHNVGQINGEYP